MNQAEPNKEEIVSTGIAGLDDVLTGGLPRGHFFLVEGEPGAGKTTLGLQFLMAGKANGESVLYVTLSESEREIQKVARSHGWSLGQWINSSRKTSRSSMPIQIRRSVPGTTNKEAATTKKVG